MYQIRWLSSLTFTLTSLLLGKRGTKGKNENKNLARFTGTLHRLGFDLPGNPLHSGNDPAVFIGRDTVS